MPNKLEESMSRNRLPQDLLEKCRSEDEKDRRKAAEILLEYLKKKNVLFKDEVIEKLNQLLIDDYPEVRDAAEKALQWKPGPHRPWKKILLIAFFVLIVLFGILEITGTLNLIPGFPSSIEPEDNITPEAAFKGAFDAMKAGDIDAIAQYLPEDERLRITEMSNEDKEMLQMQKIFAMMSSTEIKVIDSEIVGDIAVVTIEFTCMDRTTVGEVELMLENGRWVLIDGIF